MRFVATAGVLAALAVASPSLAQGHGRGHGPGTPPSRNRLPAPSGGAPSSGASPFAWLEDASILEPGSVSASISVTRWQGTDSSEIDLPVVEVGIGLTDRVHLAASVPRIVDGAATGGAVGGVGTSFFTAKIALVDGRPSALKLSASPTLELLSDGVVESLGGDTSRVQFGVPVSVELERGPVRWFSGGGYFSGGIWFGGGGAAVRAGNKVVVSASVTRSWRHESAPIDTAAVDRHRNDLSAGVGYALTPRVSMYASAGHTVATADEDGAGATIGAGMSLFLPPPRK
jgi:hypothetical protein